MIETVSDVTFWLLCFRLSPFQIIYERLHRLVRHNPPEPQRLESAHKHTHTEPMEKIANDRVEPKDLSKLSLKTIYV